MDHLPNHRQSPWHAGEKALHEKVGVSEFMEAYGRRVIRDQMPDQHRDFYRQLPFMIAGAVDTQGRPWATLLEGPEGFVTSPDPRRLLLSTGLDPQDPAASGFDAGCAIGLLGIELHTRRRNRINGVLQQVEEGRLEVAVEHSFGNCPQYIQKRLYTREDRDRKEQGSRQDFTSLDQPLKEMICTADTFFVASYIEHEHGQRSVDVAHRGGRPGFIKVTGNRLTIPDYAGNLHFNTLGNLQLNPMAGLLFVDFLSGDVLQLCGTTALISHSPMIAAFEGAERLWTLDVQRAVLRPRALSIRWTFQEYASTSLMTGTWDEADEKQRHQWQRQEGKPSATTAQPPPATVPVPVYFAASAKEARWKPGSGSLLELAESRGLAPEFSCRDGSCGICRATVTSGKVHYPHPPAQMPDDGTALICCAVPAMGQSGVQPLILEI